VRAPRKWVAHGLSNTIVYGALLHGGVRLPVQILRGISFIGNSLASFFMRRTRREVAGNYERALGCPPGRADRLARQLFFEYGRTTVDLWRCRSGQADLAPKLTTLERDSVILRGQLRGGRGFLLVSGHVGNWEMGAVALASLGLKAAVLGQPELDPDVHAMRLKIRSRLGVESIDTGSSIATALRVRAAVDEGKIIALAADRAFEEDQITVPFFGRPTPFLRTPALLARFCDCPILPCFFLRNRDGSYRGVFGSPLRPDPRLSPEEDARRLMTGVAAEIERVVREEPAQWFNFFSYWPD
jgi:lauroyl/myristoyl acyltransferase